MAVIERLTVGQRVWGFLETPLGHTGQVTGKAVPIQILRVDKDSVTASVNGAIAQTYRAEEIKSWRYRRPTMGN